MALLTNDEILRKAIEYSKIETYLNSKNVDVDVVINNIDKLIRLPKFRRGDRVCIYGKHGVIVEPIISKVISYNVKFDYDDEMFIFNEKVIYKEEK